MTKYQMYANKVDKAIYKAISCTSLLHYTSVQTNTNFYSLAELVLSSLTVCLLSWKNLLMYVTVSVGVLQIHLRRLGSWLVHI